MPIGIPNSLAKKLGLSGDPARDRVSRYVALRGFCIGDGVDVQPGDEVDLPAAHARRFLVLGKIRPASAPAPTPAGELVDGDPALDAAEAPTAKARAPRVKKAAGE